MYAAAQDRGHQYQVAPGARFTVDRMDVNDGDTVEMPVLFLSEESGVMIGTLFVEGTRLPSRSLKAWLRVTKVSLVPSRPKIAAVALASVTNTACSKSFPSARVSLKFL